MPVERVSSSLQHSDFAKWFPANVTSKIESPVFTLLCIHGAGMEQLVFTGKGTPRAPQPNPMLEYCMEERIEILAAQLPGRALRHKEKCFTSAQEVAEELFNVIKDIICGSSGRYAICAHSMGCLCAYELLHLIKKYNLPLPAHVFFSCMISADTPEKLKPWKKSKELDDKQFMEEVRRWNVNEAVFEFEMWEIYGSLFRSDFPIFDEYIFTHKNQPPIGLNATAFYAKDDKRVTEDLMHGWKNLLCCTNDDENLSSSSCSFELKCIQGNHAFLYDKNDREYWMRQIINKIECILLEIDYGGC